MLSFSIKQNWVETDDDFFFFFFFFFDLLLPTFALYKMYSVGLSFLKGGLPLYLSSTKLECFTYPEIQTCLFFVHVVNRLV